MAKDNITITFRAIVWPTIVQLQWLKFKIWLLNPKAVTLLPKAKHWKFRGINYLIVTIKATFKTE